MLDADDPTMDAVDLAEHWQMMADAIADAGVLGKPTMSASMDVHIAMVLSSAGRYDALKEQIAIMGEYDPATVTARFLEARETSTTISRAMNAHGQGDFAGAARLLRSLDIERCAAKQTRVEALFLFLSFCLSCCSYPGPVLPQHSAN